MEEFDYRKKLKEYFLEKQSRNQNYSMRAFARDLKISVTAIHGILNESRHLSAKNLEKVSEKFGWSENQTKYIQSKINSTTEIDVTAKTLFEDEFQLIADWKHLAILNVIKIPQMTSELIAQQLNLEVNQVQEILQRLLRLNFIQIDHAGVIQRSLKSFGTTQDVPSTAIRAFHYQNLAKAQESIYSVPLEQRDFLTIVCATDDEKIQKVKKQVQEFRKKIQKELESENPDRVYFCNLQLYPVTNLRAKDNA